MVNQLMNFRLAYLRAIAKAWNDEGFKEILTTTENLLESEDPVILELFSNVHLGNISVKIIDYEENPSEWHPKKAAGWIGPDDYFHINLPGTPHVEEQAQALAAYYELFPTIFGAGNNEEEIETEDRKPVVGGPLPQGLGVDPESFLDFGGVTLRAVALAWNDKTFLDELTKDNLKDKTPVLSKYLGYNNPWNFNILFNYCDDFTWNGASWSDSFPNNRVVLHYPRKPDDISYEAIALTSYNNTGPEYPFSCV